MSCMINLMNSLRQNLQIHLAFTEFSSAMQHGIILDSIFIP